MSKKKKMVVQKAILDKMIKKSKQNKRNVQRALINEVKENEN